MHIHTILILFAIPSLILAEKCPHQFQNPRTKRIETTWSCCKGYDKVTGGNCIPICNTPCGNGNCDSPNVCKCDEGYQNMNNDTSKGCAPVCDGCENGYCVAPRVCDKCSKGFSIINKTCYAGEEKSEMQTTDIFFNAWTVGISVVVLVVVIIAIAAFIRVLCHKNNTKNTSVEGFDNHVMVTKE